MKSICNIFANVDLSPWMCKNNLWCDNNYSTKWQYVSTRFGLRNTTRRMDSQEIFQMSNTIVSLRFIKVLEFCSYPLVTGGQNTLLLTYTRLLYFYSIRKHVITLLVLIRNWNWYRNCQKLIKWERPTLLYLYLFYVT